MEHIKVTVPAFLPELFFIEEVKTMRTIKKEEKIRTDWHGILKEINRIGVFGAKKVQNITIKPYESDLYERPMYTMVIDTMEERDD